MLKIGLTGGIGSGKTTVAEQFALIDVPVIDTDVISHHLSRSEHIIEEIRKHFGDDVVAADGQLDRKALGALVFSDPEKLRQLEAIMHPRIRYEVKQQLLQYPEADYVVLVVPLLLETDFHQLVDRILVVDIPEDEQIARVRQRDDRDEAAIRAIIASQVSRADRLERADDIVDNTGTEEALSQRIAELDRQYKQMTKGGE